uniref:CSON001102 protein n=1 Tax=Culicoides sonorensis TaxID=179676 RepID=A0A336KVT5_CULSO
MIFSKTNNYSWFAIFVITIWFNVDRGTAADNNNSNSWINNPEVELPPSMIICTRNAPAKERNECIQKSINSLLPTLKDGYPPLGINSIDPYTVKKTTLAFKQGPVTARLYMKDAMSSGLTKGRVKAVRSKVNDNKMYLEIDVHFPKLRNSANYKGSGGYNDLKVNSAGTANVSHTSISSTWKMYGKIETVNGEDYMMIKAFEVAKLDIKNMEFNATGIFPEPELNEFVVQFVNQYWSTFYHQLLPQARSMYEPIVLEAINKVFARVPFRRLMPKDETIKSE